MTLGDLLAVASVAAALQACKTDWAAQAVGQRRHRCPVIGRQASPHDPGHRRGLGKTPIFPVFAVAL